MDDVAFRGDGGQVGKRGAEVGVEGDDEEEFHEEGKERGEEDAEGGVDVDKTEEADGEGCGLAEESGDSRSVRVQCVPEEGGDLAVIKSAVESATEDINADCEGIDVVHAEMV